MLAGLRSIPIAFAGGLGLGVVQNLIAGYSNDFLPKVLSNLTGLKASVPFILVIVLLLVFGRDRSRRGGSVAEDAPRPDHRKGMSALRRRLPWALWTLVLVAYSQDWIGVKYLRADTYAQTVLANGLAVAVIFLSFVVVTGAGGDGELCAGRLRHHRWGCGRVGPRAQLERQHSGDRRRMAISTSCSR